MVSANPPPPPPPAALDPPPPPPPITNTLTAVTPAGTVQLIVVEAAVNLTTQSPLASRSAVTPVITSTV